MSDHLKTSFDEGVLTLTFARPEKKNALTNAMYGAWADAMEAAATCAARPSPPSHVWRRQWQARRRCCCQPAQGVGP